MEVQQTRERAILLDTTDQRSTLLKLVHRDLARMESMLAMGQSAWEEVNSLFGVDGRIAAWLRRLPQSHDCLLLDEALTILKARFVAYAVRVSSPDMVRKISDELGAVQQEATNFAASIRSRALAGRIVDLNPV